MHPLLVPFEAICARRAAEPAVCDAQLRLDYQSLHAVAGGLAGRVAEATQQRHVGLLAPSSSACAAAILACWYAGKTPVPLNFFLAPSELAKVVRDAELDLVLTTEHFAPLADGLRVRQLPLGSETLVPGQPAAPAAKATDLGVLIYTSGTSGNPKGVCLTFENLVRNVEACVQAAGLTPAETFLSLLPQFHAFGFTTNTLVPLLIGAPVHYLPRFAPATVVNTIAQERITVFITVASMFGALVAMKDARREQFATLRLPVSGGEPLSPRVAQAFEQRFGQRIYEGYGMTEASPVVTLNTPGAVKEGSVGRPLPGVTVVAVDDDGTPRPPNCDGQLLVRGHCVMAGYRHQPELTAQAIRDGALWTGDIGRVDDDGFVHITGRAKEMMIVGGENVFPIEIESVLVQHPAVAEAAAIGMRDDVRGEVPIAFVTLVESAAPVSDQELRAFCRGRLAGYKVPRRVIVADELPRGPTGKILKRGLRLPGA